MKKTPTTKKGEFSIEQLHHFRCGLCKKWWSIGDPSIATGVLKKEWFCPWCGAMQKVIKSK